MNDTGVVSLRSSIRRALEVADAEGMPADVRMCILVCELGNEMASAASNADLPQLITSIQAAVEYAASTSGDPASIRTMFCQGSA